MIINLTQHPASAEQKSEGVSEPADKAKVKELLTFASVPHQKDVKERADKLAQIAAQHGASSACIGGAPYLMGPLESALKAIGIQPLYSFSERISKEYTDPSGNVQKKNVFRHIGWVEA